MKDSREVRAGQPTGAPQTLTVREVVIDLMRRHGMTKVFANPGSTELPLFRDFPPDFEYVLGLQEAVVVGMADGYAQASGNAAFINLHSAAGVGNAMGNIFTAYKNQTPLIVTAGQQARAILPFDPFLYNERAAEFPRPYVKYSVEPARAEDVPLALIRAFMTALTPPMGPVYVSIPVDDWDRECTMPDLPELAAPPADPVARFEVGAIPHHHDVARLLRPCIAGERRARPERRHSCPHGRERSPGAQSPRRFSGAAGATGKRRNGGCRIG